MTLKRSILSSPDGLAEGLGLKSFLAFFSVKAIRGGPRLLPQLAICIVVLITLTRIMPSRLSDIAFGSSYTKILKWRPSGYADDDGSVGGGLRVVVFGGGDIATPIKPHLEGEPDPGNSWTEILCQELKQCNTHLSYIPATDNHFGSLVSNPLYEAMLNRMASANATDAPGYDYSWMKTHYPVPSDLPDLKTQMDTFLAAPAPHRRPHETLWVFNLGYWDIWALASVPRQVALDIIQVQMTHLFEQIEFLYQQAREESSIAYSDFYTVLNNYTAPPNVNNKHYESVVLDVPAESFRVLITSPFDISLTPGFETARFKPPAPHSPAEELRNAAWLNYQWETTMTQAIDSWLKTPDPLVNGTTNETQLVERLDAAGSVVLVPNARREVITYDPTQIVRDLITDRQLKEAEIQDHNGVGSMDEEKSFLDVWEPCNPIVKHASLDGMPATTEGACARPDDHLYWTEFTIGQRAIREIGRLAAIRFDAHVQLGTNWLKKWQTNAEKNTKSFIG